LFVEDSESDAQLMLHELRRNGFEPNWLRVEQENSFRAALDEEKWDLILADYHLPEFSGLEALQIYREKGLDVPFLIVSGAVSEELAVSAMLAGAHDYLQKDNLARLGAAVIRELREHQVRRGRDEDHLRVVASERRFTTIFANSPVATIIADVREGRILDLNPAALTLTGLRRQEAVGRPTKQFGDWFDPTERARAIASALAEGPGHAIERVLVSPVRGAVPVLASFSLIELDGQARLLVMMQDITARKAAEETLRESEERYRLLVEHSYDLVAELNLDGGLLYASPNYLQVTGYAPSELNGAHALDLIHPEDHVAFAIHLEPKSRHTHSRYRFRHRNGAWLHFESTSRTFTTSGGDQRAVLVTRDLTEQQRSEEVRRVLEIQLRQAQKMEAIGTLAGGIAHDFNNILTAIFGYVQLAELELPPDHPARSYLSGVLSGSERARDLVAQILTFSRRREQQRSISRMSVIVQDALKLLRASLPATIRFQTEIDPNAPPVLCDGTQIHQVIMNLGANAAYAMRDNGGSLIITLKEAEVDPTVAATHPQFKRRRPVCLTISDTGAGMDAGTRDRIFEPFFTTKPIGEGTGLGLAVVHGIVQNHEGLILCDSQPGHGTTFRILFPAVDVEGIEAPVAPSRLPRGSGQRVLLVDDEDAVVSIASRMLQRLGYQTTAFNDSRAALERLLANPEQFDVILTDLTMSGVTGVDIAREARALRPDLPVIITTGYMNARDVESARALGVSQFLEKPFALAALAECLQQAVHSARRLAEAEAS
jgi:PAS domain S-box-containing protein